MRRDVEGHGFDPHRLAVPTGELGDPSRFDAHLMRVGIVPPQDERALEGRGEPLEVRANRDAAAHRLGALFPAVQVVLLLRR